MPYFVREDNNRTFFTMKRIIGIGETVFDIIFKSNQPQAAVPGGSTFNSMISLGRTAAKRGRTEVLMISETGSDQVGDIIASFMEDNGVSVQAVTRAPGTQTQISLAFLDENNDAHYEFYKGCNKANLNVSIIENFDIGRDDIVLFGSFFAINPDIRDFTRTLLMKARAAGATIYYDINFRKNFRNALPELINNIEENCKLSDFVRGSVDDFDCLFDNTDPEFIYNEKIKDLCPNLIVTRGDKSTEYFRSDGRHFSFPIEHIETVSTIGAGDNFNAGFIYGLLDADIRREDCHCLEEAILARSISMAIHFSSNVCRSFNNYVDNDFKPEDLCK